jgi:hypothetical protein
MLEAERSLTVDLTTAWTRARDVSATINHKGMQLLDFPRANQNVVAVATLLDTLPASSADGVDRVYHQLKDILGIITTQQAKCSLQR